ncbi:MAG: penicillin-binding protein 2 [Oligoflexia bacterium]|nr:penicillin-binding protein 2 [Oligoflexia bacterium]
MAFLGQEEQIREFQDRFKYLYAAVLIGLGLLVARLVYLQILSGDKMRQYSEENRIKRVKVDAPRGMIFDRNRKLLIDNRPAFDLEITPQYFKEYKQQKEVVQLLTKLVRMPEKDIYEALEKSRGQPSFMPVKIKTDLTRDEVAGVESWKIEMPGVEVRQEIKRTNIYGDIASHLLGYVGEVNSSELPILNKESVKYRQGDNVGKFGLEQRMENTLRGVDGEELKEVDALGRIKLEKGKDRVLGNATPDKMAIPGRNLVLTIDQDLQLAAAQAFGDKNGALVAIDPRSGEILAMMSRPSFDPTEFSRGISSQLWNRLLNNPNRPLRDKTIQDHYSPGSTFKPITAIAGLEEGVIDEKTTFNCSGSLRVGNRVYHCWNKHGHGNIDVVRAITQSCDVFFYRVAMKMNSVDQLSKWATRLGLGKKTGIDLKGEVPGLIPTEEWKEQRFKQPWLAGETLSVAIGQSYVLTTAIQMANAYASIGNGGALWKPYLVKSVESFEGKTLKEFKSEEMGQTHLHPKTVELVKEGLWGVVNTPHGTAYSSRIPGVDFAGKTGTVQNFRIAADKIYQKCENMKFEDRHNGFFVGFAPLKDPVIAVAVIGEHVCHGGAMAPVARAVIKTYLEKYFPDIYGPKAIAARLAAEKSAPVKKAPAPEPVNNATEQEDVQEDNNDQLPARNAAPPIPALPPGIENEDNASPGAGAGVGNGD